MILVAEDDKSVRDFVLRALRADGYDVVAVDNGMKALEALSKNDFDLLLTDIRMPVMDGIALALKASKDWPDMPIILMTGYATEEQRAHNLDSLIHGVISKPFTLREIRTMMKSALSGNKSP